MEIAQNQKKRKKSALDWSELVSKHQSSGKSQKAFCESENISLGTFKVWRKRLNPDPKQSTRGFMQLPSVTTKTKITYNVELELPGDITLRIGTTDNV